jgi:signal transduction histidine kinase
VNQILEDDLGHFWIGCNRGIYRVRRADLNAVADGRASTVQCVVYGEADGMLSSETNGEIQPAGCKTRDGRLWFPTTKGIVMIDPAKVTRNELAPPVVIEQVIADEEIIYGDGRTSRRKEAQFVIRHSSFVIRLPPGRARVLEIHYTAPSFIAPDKIRFQYRLEGHDRAWRDAANRRVAIYTNLRPGNYTFRVKACNNHGVWNERGAAFAFSLAPHFYQTGRFYGLCALALALTGYGLHRALTRRQQRQALERERTRLSRDMHDELGATLSQIARLSEDPSIHSADAAGRSSHVRALADKIREARRQFGVWIWTMNAEKCTGDHFADFVHGYAANFFADTPIRLHLDLPDSMPPCTLAADLRQHLVLVLKEALTNILDHAQASDVHIRLAVRESTLRLEIADNGRGFEAPEGSPENIGKRTATGPRSQRPRWLQRAASLRHRLLRLLCCGRGPSALRSRSFWSAQPPADAPTGRLEAAAPTAHAFRGNGLANMQRRMQAIRGTLQIVSRPGEGTRIVVSVPL